MEHYLGKPIQEATIMTLASRDGKGRYPTLLQWYAPVCLGSPAEVTH